MYQNIMAFSREADVVHRNRLNGFIKKKTMLRNSKSTLPYNLRYTKSTV